MKSVRTARAPHINYITNMMNIFLDDLAFFWPSWILQWLAAREKGKEISGFSKTWV